MKRRNELDYRGWMFRDKVKLIPKDVQWMHYLDSKFDNIDIDIDFDANEIIEPIENAIDSGVETINTNLTEKLCDVHQHIEEAKNHLCCDICCARQDIKQHIDEKIDPMIVRFEEGFSNLNEQVQTIINKLDE